MTRLLVDFEDDAGTVAGRDLDRHDLLGETALVDGGDLPFSCDLSAQASISSRLMPAIWAVFQPTVIDMSRQGASGEPRREGDIESSESCVPTVRFFAIGLFDIDCTLPATIASSMPAMIDAAAVSTAARPAAQ